MVVSMYLDRRHPNRVEAMTRLSRVTLSLGVALVPLLVASCQEATTTEPDLPGNRAIAFYNGNVITMNPVSRVDAAILLRGSRVIATGSSERIRREAGREGIEVDLDGRTIMPGFVDPHNHAFTYVFLGGDSDEIGTTYSEAQQALLTLGTTTIGDPNFSPALTADFMPFGGSDQLRVRTSVYLLYNDVCGVRQPEDWYLGYPLIDEPSAMLRIPGLKFYADGGVCGGGGAYSWLQSPGSRLWVGSEDLAAAMVEAVDLGYQVAVHSLGDVAADTVLRALEIANEEIPGAFRPRMEHNQIIRPEQLSRYGEVGAVPVVFGYPRTCSMLDGGWFHRLNDDPSAFYVRPWLLPWRVLLDENPGLRVAWHGHGGSWTYNPIVHLWGLTTRDEMRDDGSVCEAPAWLEAGAVTVEEAVEMMTINGAYALGMDQAVGSLRAGKLADLVVLSDNPLDVDPAALKDLEVLMTMVGGKIEHCQSGSEALCPLEGP